MRTSICLYGHIVQIRTKLDTSSCKPIHFRVRTWIKVAVIVRVTVSLQEVNVCVCVCVRGLSTCVLLVQ